MKKWFLSFLVIIAFVPVYGQNSGLYYLAKDYEDDPYDEFTYFNLGLNLLNNNTYLGRKDSTRLPYISPFVGYHLRNGLYARASVSYALTHKSGHFDLATVEVGYDRSFGRNVLAGVFVEKYFYYANSTAIKYAIKESGGMYCQYKNDLIEPQLSVVYNHSSTMDFVVGTTFDHDFRFAQNTWNIIPAITINIGTQNFYNEYFINRALKKENIIINNKVVDNAGGIKGLDIEFSAKTTYRVNGWFFTLIPTYAIPLGAGKITLPKRVVQEKLHNTFIVELDVCYRHARK